MTRETIGGSLSLDAYAALAGNPDQARMRHFHALTRADQAAAIKRMAATGQSERAIAQATQLSIEMIQRVLAEHGEQP